MSQTMLPGTSGARKRYLNCEQLITPPDLVNRQFAADVPNQLWCRGITDHPVGQGKGDCYCVIDVLSRRIVDWTLSTRQTTNALLNAFDIAVEARKPSHKVIRFDHGTQFASWAFARRVGEAELFGSTGKTGDRGENVTSESLWQTTQVGLRNRKKSLTRIYFTYPTLEHDRVTMAGRETSAH